jgi:hypothetical protein
MKIIVDNSAGGDGRFADEVAAGLRREGLVVELREPVETAVFDTGVHLVSAGIAIRVSAPPDRAELTVIERVVREALLHRPNPRRRTRSVPLYLGETARALAWIDVIE